MSQDQDQDQAQVQSQAQAAFAQDHTPAQTQTTQNSSQPAQASGLTGTQAQAYTQAQDVIATPATPTPLSSNHQRAVATAAQALSSPSSANSNCINNAPTSSPSLANPDTRTHVVGELYDTERSYVESLQILVEKYIKPLKSLDSNRVLIDSNLVDEIFYTIPEILQHHENFLSALQDRLSSDWDTSQVIGNVFIKAFTNQQIINTYTAFINNWKNARQAIKVATQAKPAFERFLEAMSREHRNKLTLDALLIMPVQRIPRYELLIKELLKHTAEDHPDYGPLMEAQKEIHELALKIDRAEKEMIHQEQLKDIESMIEGHVELQNSQREFIRYDLITIVGHLSLNVTKKERVLFLFCDLLIMTSVKKKASRRSNLQTAFANSANDLSLLEGNKFKLLMRVPLDHVEIRLSNDQIQIQHQYQEHQHQLQLQQQSKFIQERKDEVNSDLYILHQIEALSSKMIVEERSRIIEVVNELTSQLKQKLFEIERNEVKFLSCSQQQAFIQQSCQLPCEFKSQLPTTPSASMPSSSMQLNHFSSLGHQPYIINNNSPSLIPSGSPSTLASNQNDTSTSLEFLISNNNHPIKDSLTAEMSSLNISTEPNANEQGYVVANQGENQQPTNYDSLVVTFPSIERRQAFLLSFIEAKLNRYQRQQQYPKMYSSSVTLRLSHSPDRRSLSHESHCKSKLQHQDNLENRQTMSTNQSPVCTSKLTSRCSKLQQQYLTNQQITAKTSLADQVTCGTAIMHQMSAPQSLNLATVSDTFYDRKEQQQHNMSSCSVSSDADDKHHHHHHQLMHQPKNSCAAFLDTICCNEQHNNEVTTNSFSKLQMNRFTHLDDSIFIDQAVVDGQQNQYIDYSNRLDCSVNNNLDPSINLTTTSDVEGASRAVATNDYQKAPQRANPIMFLSPSPKFVLTLPVNFLTTQHPALQFACSTLQTSTRNNNSESKSENSLKLRHQTVNDNLGQMWLCMSNGYVSHVALITISKSRGNPSSHSHDECLGKKLDLHPNLNFVPVIQAAGDICKSQINCAVQVKWMRKIYPSATSDSGNAFTASSQTEIQANNSVLERGKISGQVLEIKEEQQQRTSLSQPVDIKPASSIKEPGIESKLRFLSESAPSPSQDSCLVDDGALAKTSASTSRLEVPESVSIGKSSSVSKNSRQRYTKNNQIEEEMKRPPQATICQRHLQHTHKQRVPANLPTPSHHPVHNRAGMDNRAYFEAHRLHHTHSHHHHYHPRQNHHYHHQLSHQNQQNNNNYAPNIHTNRHNTVPLGELRKAFKQQNRISDSCSLSHSSNQYLALPIVTPPTTKAVFPSYQRVKSLDLAERGAAGGGMKSLYKNDRSTTPPASTYNVGKSFRSARLFRHQASLKTSSILAKLVSSASKRSSYLRKSAQIPEKLQKKQQSSSSEITYDDDYSGSEKQNLKQVDTSSTDGSMLALTTPGSSKRLLSASNLNENNILISPLSSVSSLASTNSSLTVNSACASSPNRSCCDLQVHSLSTSFCNRPSWRNQSYFSSDNFNSEYGLRSRSATVPSQVFCQRAPEEDANIRTTAETGYQLQTDQTGSHTSCLESYKISELTGENDEYKVFDTDKEFNSDSSLWLGCEDGSLIIIQCLNGYNNFEDNEHHERLQQNSACGNRHSEVKLGAAICDISIYKDDLVFVALTNGQLAIFSRSNENNDPEKGAWLLTNPRVVTVTNHEYDFTSKLCLVNDEHIWYSYGRNIFVLNINSLKLESTILVRTNDLSLQFTMQSISIAHMELLSDQSGVWISFKNSHLIQLYDATTYKLLVELNLFESVDKILAQGNEILRQHKTACLKATSLLNVNNPREHCDTLFIGTSAGLILYLNMVNQKVFPKDNSAKSHSSEWKPQLVGLKHGHCGPVKFLHLLEIEELLSSDHGESTIDKNNNNNNNNDSSLCAQMKESKELCLISGGKGVDLYAPHENQQISQQYNNDDDDLNHLLLWRL